jgi:hypothetical protein
MSNGTRRKGEAPRDERGASEHDGFTGDQSVPLRLFHDRTEGFYIKKLPDMVLMYGVRIWGAVGVTLLTLYFWTSLEVERTNGGRVGLVLGGKPIAIEELVARTNLPERTLRRALKKLVSLGFILCHASRAGVRVAVLYSLRDFPKRYVLKPGSSRAEKLRADFPEAFTDVVVVEAKRKVELAPEDGIDDLFGDTPCPAPTTKPAQEARPKAPVVVAPEDALGNIFRPVEGQYCEADIARLFADD